MNVISAKLSIADRGVSKESGYDGFPNNNFYGHASRTDDTRARTGLRRAVLQLREQRRDVLLKSDAWNVKYERVYYTRRTLASNSF